MRRLFVVAIVVIGLSVIATGIAFAQEPEPPVPSGIDIENLFTWLRNGAPNWVAGAAYTGLGLVGALVTLFFVVGGIIPGTRGAVRLAADYERLDIWLKKLDDFMRREPDPAVESAIERRGKQIDVLRDDLARDRRSQFAIGAALYALLGAFFAAMLAQDILQALVIGAGWTGFAGALGLKKEQPERQSEREKELKTNTEAVLALEGKLEQVKREMETAEELSWDSAWDYEKDVERALDAAQIAAKY